MSEPATKIQRTDGEPPAEGGPNEPAAARAGTMQSSVSKETPISIPPTITYGLQETHTTIIPTIFWLTAANLTNDTSPTLNITLNSLYNILSDTTIATTTSPNIVTSIHQRKAQNMMNMNDGSDSYPAQLSDQNPDFWYRSYYGKMYMYYTVLNCNYEITLYNASNSDALATYTIRTLGNANNTVIPNNMRFVDIYGMKNINYRNLPGLNNETQSNRCDIIRGNYKPGTAKKDVSNDGDTKLWTLTGQGTTYKEQLQLQFWRNPLFPRSTTTNGTNTNVEVQNVNIQVQLKYTVQYKQLKQSFSYPTYNATGISTRFPDDPNPYLNDL